MEQWLTTVGVIYMYLACLKKVKSYFNVHSVTLRINPSPTAVVLLPGTSILKKAPLPEHVPCLREKWCTQHKVFLLLEGSWYFHNKLQCDGAQPVH